MSLFIDLTIRLPNREASSEQFSAMLLLLKIVLETLPKIVLKKPSGLGGKTSNQ